VLHLDSATHSLVEEFSTSGFLGHRVAEDARHVLVVPASDSAIDSTTSNSLTKIAERDGWIIEKARVSARLVWTSLCYESEILTYRPSFHSTPLATWMRSFRAALPAPCPRSRASRGHQQERSSLSAPIMRGGI
jgi:branched-chain amino acid aminotransferase